MRKDDQQTPEQLSLMFGDRGQQQPSLPQAAQRPKLHLVHSSPEPRTRSEEDAAVSKLISKVMLF